MKTIQLHGALWIMIIAALLCLGLTVLTGCKSFEPVQVENECPECNDFYTVLKYNVKNTGQDSAFVGTVYEQCKQARAEIRKQARENHCAKLFFPSGVVDKSNYKQYAQYLECCK